MRAAAPNAVKGGFVFFVGHGEARPRGFCRGGGGGGRKGRGGGEGELLTGYAQAYPQPLEWGIDSSRGAAQFEVTRIPQAAPAAAPDEPQGLAVGPDGIPDPMRHAIAL